MQSRVRVWILVCLLFEMYYDPPVEVGGWIGQVLVWLRACRAGNST